MIEEALLSRYPGDYHRTVTVREFLQRVCRKHIELGFADSTFENNLCCGNDSIYWQRLSEALFCHHLLEGALKILPSLEGCPDIHLQCEKQDIWIEVICPEPKGVPEEWLQSNYGSKGSAKVRRLPHETILLRWTAAIKEKAEKLIGTPTKEVAAAKPGYLDKGVVAGTEPYVIAVNGRLLRGGYFGSIFGISQFPFALEAVFPVGPYHVKFDSHTLKTVEEGHQYRPAIKNQNGSPVSTLMFLDPAYQQISAIWAADMDETFVIGNSNVMAVVHNPTAANPISPGLLPAHWEYLAVKKGDEYEIERIPGCMNEAYKS